MCLGSFFSSQRSYMWSRWGFSIWVYLKSLNHQKFLNFDHLWSFNLSYRKASLRFPSLAQLLPKHGSRTMYDGLPWVRVGNVDSLSPNTYYSFGIQVEGRLLRKNCLGSASFGLSASVFLIHTASSANMPWPRILYKWLLTSSSGKRAEFSFLVNSALDTDSICLPLVGPARMNRHPPRLTWVVTSQRARTKPAFISCWHLWRSHNEIRKKKF